MDDGANGLCKMTITYLNWHKHSLVQSLERITSRWNVSHYFFVRSVTRLERFDVAVINRLLDVIQLNAQGDPKLTLFGIYCVLRWTPKMINRTINFGLNLVIIDGTENKKSSWTGHAIVVARNVHGSRDTRQMIYINCSWVRCPPRRQIIIIHFIKFFFPFFFFLQIDVQC